MTVNVTHTLADLERDCRAIPRRAVVGMAKTVRDNAKLGNTLAKGIARRSAGKHGKHYPDSFTAEALSPLIWEYGPDDSKPQGDMSFEYGSRKQPPHMDLNKSADLIEFQMGVDIRDLVKGLFW